MKNFRFIISILVFTSLAVFPQCDSNKKEDNLSQLALINAIRGSYSNIQIDHIDPPKNGSITPSGAITIFFKTYLDDSITGTVTLNGMSGVTYGAPDVIFWDTDAIRIDPSSSFPEGIYTGLTISGFKDDKGKTVQIIIPDYKIYINTY